MIPPPPTSSWGRRRVGDDPLHARQVRSDNRFPTRARGGRCGDDYIHGYADGGSLDEPKELALTQVVFGEHATKMTYYDMIHAVIVGCPCAISASGLSKRS